MKPPMLFNPYTGQPRHPLDIQSDPHGLLIIGHDEQLRPAQPTASKPEARAKE